MEKLGLYFFNKYARIFYAPAVKLRQYFYEAYGFIYELATVISRKFGHEFTHAILDDIQQTLKLLDIGDFEKEIWKEFRVHKKRNISFFDCANLVAAKHYGLKIASFDQFYPKSLRVS